MAKDVTIGIDLGTSNSCVCAMLDGKPTVLANKKGERVIASVVAFHEDGKIEVGNSAKARIILDPKHTVSSAKRLIGRYFFSEEVRKARAVCKYEIVPGENHGVRIKIREEEFSLPEISAFVLKEMKAIAEGALGRPVSGAVITVPAYFNDNQRQATKDAGRIAGLDVLRILNEPTAAALSYGYGKDLRQKVAIYDLGGGTFDVSILEIGKDVFEVLATAGDTYLGGDDFDDRVIDLLADKVQSEHGVNVRPDPYAFAKLRMAAETAKIELAEQEEARISIPDLAEHEGKTIGVEYTLTRKDFDKLIRDLILRTFKVCDEALQQASLTTRDLNGVILVGGPTRLPSIRNAVKEYFQRDPETGINPDEVVAMGAAIHAASLAAPEAGSYLLDVTPLTLRMGIAGGLSESIIERNSPVPIDQMRVFTTVRDHQQTIAVRIYQGESRQAEGNTLLGEFEFSGFAPGPRGEVKIEVTFSISTEGIVKVQARDPKTGAEASTTVSMSSGLSEEQIQSIMAKDRASDVAASAVTPQRAKRSKPDNAPVPVTALEETDENLLELPALEADVQDLLEKPDAEPAMFGKVDGDLGGEAQEPIRPHTELGGGPREIELEEAEIAPEDDDQVLGDD
ncbi:MAG TPA: Hsp70 family protein [Myxococcota bacterium]|nr:Hsp70 family protein [Myxococcota bacterium]